VLLALLDMASSPSITSLAARESPPMRSAYQCGSSVLAVARPKKKSPAGERTATGPRDQ
jgi:hypothetical protein